MEVGLNLVYQNLSNTDKQRDEFRVGSGFGKNVSNWIGRDLVYPNNVLYLATECSNQNHSATFPLELPEWFIKLFTKQGDIVLDPFIGSGTTALASIKLGRCFIGIDIKEYVELTNQRISAANYCMPMLSEKRSKYKVNNKRRIYGQIKA